MKAVIAAGGRGKRISSLFPDIPKPMIEIDGKPVILRAVEELVKNGITDIIITTGYRTEVIEDFFTGTDIPEAKISFFEEKEPLGSAGALFRLRNLLTEDFLFINGDLLFSVDIGRLTDFHFSRGALITLLTHPNSHPFDSTLIEADSSGRVSNIYSGAGRPESCKNRVNAGIHVISPEIFSVLSFEGKADLDGDVIFPVVSMGKVFCFDSPEYVKDMGTEDRYYTVCRDIKAGLPEMKNLKNRQRAVFLDRDGTLNEYRGFITRPEEIALTPEAADTVKLINSSGFLAVVITNQPVVARGQVTPVQLEQIHNRLEALLGEKGAYLDGIFYCPHHPDGGYEGEIPELKIKCGCRKPQPGLFIAAAEKFNIDLSRSYMIGDSDTDIQAASAAGCTGIKIPSGSLSENTVRGILTENNK